MNIEIKKIEKEEAGIVVELFNQYRIFYKQESDITVAARYIQDRLNNKESIVFVAFLVENNKSIPVGFTQLYPSYSSVSAMKYWTLNDLFVAPGYRKAGVGALLIHTVIEFARKEHATKIELSTGVDNATAQRLYAKIGFVRQQPDREYYTYILKLN
jgi:GNAT superfamily N-acetyltransferase